MDFGFVRNSLTLALAAVVGAGAGAAVTQNYLGSVAKEPTGISSRVDAPKADSTPAVQGVTQVSEQDMKQPSVQAPSQVGNETREESKSAEKKPEPVATQAVQSQTTSQEGQADGENQTAVKNKPEKPAPPEKSESETPSQRVTSSAQSEPSEFAGSETTRTARFIGYEEIHQDGTVIRKEWHSQ